MVSCCCKRPLQTTSSEPVEGSGVYKSPALLPPLLLPGPAPCGFAIRLLPSSPSCVFDILPARFSDSSISTLGQGSLGRGCFLLFSALRDKTSFPSGPSPCSLPSGPNTSPLICVSGPSQTLPHCTLSFHAASTSQPHPTLPCEALLSLACPGAGGKGEMGAGCVCVLLACSFTLLYQLFCFSFYNSRWLA